MRTKTLLLAAALMMGAQCMKAQDQKTSAPEPPQPTQEQVIEMMANRTASDLMLNEATTAKFIPIYENYLKAMDEVRAKYADKACCGQRPDGRKDGPRHEGFDPRRDDKRGPHRDKKDAPKGAPAPEAKKPAEGPACGGEGGACCAPKPLTDAEVEKRVKDRIALMREEADIQEKYYKELRTILTPLQAVRAMDFRK
jgi:hypothetical protein